MGEKSRVIFLENFDKLRDALKEFNIYDFADREVLLKLHMGEIGNRYHPKSSDIRKVVDILRSFRVKPFLFDTTVAYNSLRQSRKGYEKVAAIHGFTRIAEVVIDDKGIPVEVANRVYEVAEHIYSSTHIISYAHVKGHLNVGTGGSIKNFGMGGVTKESKKKMHLGSRPISHEDRCTRCGRCIEVCPANAISIKKSVWMHSLRRCFGCGLCVENCIYSALTYQDLDLQYSIACAAKACLDGKKTIYINELRRISRSCDCDPSAGPIICPDIGFLVSNDPVAVDKASLDMIYELKPNVFKEINHVDPIKQIIFGEEIGLGSSSYKLESF
ncbi:MAG: hypothetical protein DRN12_04680 [Thermoplasmata archaeon]|nr:MAG: hypothetical protein DRN12_04680 [Thermoplasmata archaeon]